MTKKTQENMADGVPVPDYAETREVGRFAGARTHTYRGYSIMRGGYHHTTDDRIDRWYIDPIDSRISDRRGSGFATLRDAKQHIDDMARSLTVLSEARHD